MEGVEIFTAVAIVVIGTALVWNQQRMLALSHKKEASLNELVEYVAELVAHERTDEAGRWTELEARIEGRIAGKLLTLPPSEAAV